MVDLGCRMTMRLVGDWLLTVFGGDLYGQNGSVASPYYPRDYPHQVTYTWTVTVNVSWRVKVTFQTMDLEGPRRGYCAYDYLRVSRPQLFFRYFRCSFRDGHGLGASTGWVGLGCVRLG